MYERCLFESHSFYSRFSFIFVQRYCFHRCAKWCWRSKLFFFSTFGWMFTSRNQNKFLDTEFCVALNSIWGVRQTHYNASEHFFKVMRIKFFSRTNLSILFSLGDPVYICIYNILFPKIDRNQRYSLISKKYVSFFYSNTYLNLHWVCCYLCLSKNSLTGIKYPTIHSRYWTQTHTNLSYTFIQPFNHIPWNKTLASISVVYYCFEIYQYSMADSTIAWHLIDGLIGHIGSNYFKQTIHTFNNRNWLFLPFSYIDIWSNVTT